MNHSLVILSIFSENINATPICTIAKIAAAVHRMAFAVSTDCKFSAIAFLFAGLSRVAYVGIRAALTPTEMADAGARATTNAAAGVVLGATEKSARVCERQRPPARFKPKVTPTTPTAEKGAAATFRHLVQKVLA